MLWLWVFFFFWVVLFQMFLPGSMVEKSRSQFRRFQVFEEDGYRNPASPNSDSPQPNLQVPENHHGAQFVATDPPHWQPCHHHEMPQESRHLCRSCIEIHVKLPISLLYDGVLDGCVAVNPGLGFNLSLRILVETYGVNLIFLDWWHKICCDWKPSWRLERIWSVIVGL